VLAKAFREPQPAGMKMASQIFSFIENAYDWYKDTVESSSTSINIGHYYNFLIGNRSNPTFGSCLNPTISEYLLFKWVYSKISGGTGFRMSGPTSKWYTPYSDFYKEMFGYSGNYNLNAQNQFNFLYYGISFQVTRIPSQPVSIKSLNLYDTTETAIVTDAALNLSQEQLAARIRGIDPDFKVPWPAVVEAILILGIVCLLAATLVVRFVFSPQNQYGYSSAMAGQVDSETSPDTVERLALDSLPAMVLDQIISTEKIWLSKLYEAELATQSVPAQTSNQLTLVGNTVDQLAAEIEEINLKIDKTNAEILALGVSIINVPQVELLTAQITSYKGQVEQILAVQASVIETNKYLMQCAARSIEVQEGEQGPRNAEVQEDEPYEPRNATLTPW